MISDNIAKSSFIADVLKRDIANIYRAQLAIAKYNIRIEGKELKIKKKTGATLNVRSGRLLNSLEHPDFIVQSGGTHFTVSSKIMTYMRFLDMKRSGNWKIYNRQVWGILYNNALRDIRYRYGQDIYDSVRKALEQALSAQD
jgi:hypothetical protein